MGNINLSVTPGIQGFFLPGRWRVVLLSGLFVALSACSGSGGGSTAAPTPGSPPAGGGNTVVSGKATFDYVAQNQFTNGLNYNSITAKAVRRARVELLNSAGTLLESTTTSATGDYSFTVSTGSVVRVRVRAELLASGTPGWHVRVVDNTNAGSLYAIETDSFTASGSRYTQDIAAPSGWDGTAYTATRAAAPFAILDVIDAGIQKVLGADPNAVFPQLTVNWSPDNRPTEGDTARGEIGFSFYRSTNGDNSEIYILGAANVNTDEYDRHVIAHEWTHYLEDRFGRSDSVGGGHPSSARLDPRVAFGEGLGHAFAALILDHPNVINTLGPGQKQGFNVNIENNVVFNPGWFSEGSVRAVLYDLYDAAADGADNVEIGFAGIYEVLTQGLANGVALTTIHAFAAEIKQAMPALAADIDAIVENQSIASSASDAYGANETNNGGNTRDVLPIYTELPLNGSIVNLCSIAGQLPPQSFGTFNKLGNRRFFRFTMPFTGMFTLTAAGGAGTDPDIVLHQVGVVQVARALGPTESLSRTLAAGDYVVELYEYSNITDNPLGRTCFDVSATIN